MKTKTILFCLLVTLLCSCVQQTVKNGYTYYLDSENGDDRNNGRSERMAWKTLDKIREVQLKAGDSVLFRRGSAFTGVWEVCGQGKKDKRIVIDAYGTGKKPCFTAPDSSLYTIQIRNSDYITLRNLEVINKGSQRMPYRTGVKVLCEEYGTSRHIILDALYIHDVNGSLIKHEGGGSAILIQSKGKETISVFDSLIIENCIIRRCERNAIIWSAPWSRKNWHLSTNTIVRKNLIEEVPGDGIVPIGCDGALIEYNLMRNCTDLLPQDQAAAGIWPWSCDNTTIQFNEVSDHKAPWDGQGFDSDYNCTNTTIQYNYSHDNDGGFVLICNAGKGETNPKDNIGNIGTVVQYNISMNDAVRTRETRVGIFSPTIHISGPCEKTIIRNNILHAWAKPAGHVDRKMIVSDSWGGYANRTTVQENVFYTPEYSEFKLTQSTDNMFEYNYYLGAFKEKPSDRYGKTKSVFYESFIRKSSDSRDMFAPLLEEIEIAGGTAHVKVVNKKAIGEFFTMMQE